MLEFSKSHSILFCVGAWKMSVAAEMVIMEVVSVAIVSLATIVTIIH